MFERLHSPTITAMLETPMLCLEPLTIHEPDETFSGEPGAYCLSMRDGTYIAEVYEEAVGTGTSEPWADAVVMAYAKPVLCALHRLTAELGAEANAFHALKAAFILLDRMESDMAKAKEAAEQRRQETGNAHAAEALAWLESSRKALVELAVQENMTVADFLTINGTIAQGDI